MARQKKGRGLPLAVIDNTLLTRLDSLDVAKHLPWLYKQILIPAEVKREAFKAPHKGKRRLQKLINVEMHGFLVVCTEADEVVKNILQADLDDGEAAAIAQADYKQAHLLIDENKGFNRARVMQITAVRTLQLLNMMKAVGAIPAVKPFYEKLEKTGFYLKESVRQKFLAEAGEE
jgi:predicted nucleic acid-binding protein